MHGIWKFPKIGAFIGVPADHTNVRISNSDSNGPERACGSLLVLGTVVAKVSGAINTISYHSVSKVYGGKTFLCGLESGIMSSGGGAI